MGTMMTLYRSIGKCHRIVAIVRFRACGVLGNPDGRAGVAVRTARRRFGIPFAPGTAGRIQA
ncbi:hypothetical protein GCM10022293_30490 [Azospirillum formosense]